MMRLLFVIGMVLTVIGSESFATDSDVSKSLPIEGTFVYKAIASETKNGIERELRIDWTRPADWKASDHRGAVIFFHGGGWVGGKPGQFAGQSESLVQLGLVCFRVEYRLLDRKEKLPPDTCVADASDAIRFVRKSADRFGIDPARIAAGGGSAGGHLAAYLGMMDDQVVDDVSRKPDALLLFNPVYDNGPGQWGHARVGDTYQKYSPAHQITAGDPPAIVFLGEFDSLIPVPVARNFQAKSQTAGLRSELHLYPKQPHGFFNPTVAGGKYYDETLAKSIEFLESLGWMQSR